jgi:hypothetical protein
VSALNAFVTDDEIQIFTDGACIDLETKPGTFAGWFSKVHHDAKCGAVFGCLGSPLGHILVLSAMTEAFPHSFDHAAGLFGPTLKRRFAELPSTVKLSPDAIYLIAGFSESTGKGKIVVVPGFNERGDGAYAPQTVTKYLAPYKPGFAEIWRPEAPAESGLQLLEAQRRMIDGV